MRVLVTRPEPDASRTAANLERLGHEAVVDPLLVIEPLGEKELLAGPFAAIAATSANAMRVARNMTAFDSLRAIPLYAVGGHTAAAAREAGFRSVIDAEGDATSLAQALARDLSAPARILHFAGKERAQDLGRLLAPHRLEVQVLELYRMRPARKFESAAPLLASGGFDAVLHFSPRSATTFVALCEYERLADAARLLRHVCLSQAVAAALAPLRVKCEIAAQPNEAAMLALLNS